MNRAITKKDIVIVVPVYKERPPEEELQYFYHNCRILENYRIVLVAPEGLNLHDYSKMGNAEVETFSKDYFKGISGYNRLMLSEAFYRRFEGHKYMLICQTDALVFNDKLLEWCNKGFDYIGAPWINKAFFLFQYVLVKKGIAKALYMMKHHNLIKAVGNGGLSLRRISAFIEAIKTDDKSGEWTVNEDFYWSFFAKNNGRFLKKPSANEAALFSIEVNPEKLMKQQNNTLPMGIHAWQRYNSEYWEEIVKITLESEPDGK